MKLHSFRHAAITSLLLTGLFTAPSPRWPHADKPSSATPQAQAVASFGKLPLAFEPNQGQAAEEIHFLARGAGYTAYLNASGAVLKLRQAKGATVSLKLSGANPAPRVAGQQPLPSRSNYFNGNDAGQWRRDIPNFARVEYADVYPGIDLVYYGQQRQMEYDFIVKPGADPNQIGLRVTGVEQMTLDNDGKLVLQTAAGEVIQHAPVIYQDTAAGRQTISGGYVLRGAGEVAFNLGAYDAALPLVIDPVIAYASYLGGPAADAINDVAVDAAGNAYVVGETAEIDNFPAGQLLGEGGLFNNDGAVFVAKLNGDGTLAYTTIINGRNDDKGIGIAVDAAGVAYVTGFTTSANFPLAAPFQDRLSPGVTITFGVESDAFVLKLNAAGNQLLYSTFLGGRDLEQGLAIAINAARQIYVTGFSSSGNFPTQNAFQNASNFQGGSFLTVFASDGQSLVYSSLLFGTGEAKAIAVDAGGNAYLTGRSENNALPARGANGTSPFRATNAGGNDTFVAKFNPAAAGNASLVYATYLGGAGTDDGRGIAVDDLNRAYVTGITGSFNFPLQGALDSTNQINEAYVTCLNANGSGLVFSTFLGGSGTESGEGIALDAARNVYVVGSTSSANFLRLNAAQANFGGASDAFLTKLAAGGTSFLFSTTLGGSQSDGADRVALDPRGNLYLGGGTTGSFPVSNAAQASFGGGGKDGWIARLNASNPDTIGVFNRNTAGFLLSNALPAGTGADITAFLGAANDRGVTGDWNGDGVDTIGVFRDGSWFLHNTNVSTGTTDITVNGFGQAGDLPVVGDWDSDGVDTIGLFRVVGGTTHFLLRLHDNVSTAAANNVEFSFGNVGDLPVVGDWDGNGTDTVGVLRAAAAGVATEFRLTNQTVPGVRSIIVSFGQGGDVPVAGDWDGDGIDTVGVFRASTWLIRKFTNDSTAGTNNIVIAFGNVGELPQVGDWNGQP